ncbi:MAG TPA: glycosyltransferase family 4 protein [Myxococcota bacterium]|nr:glycosyltransferase family 4 protein [Myxococcota bacterium]HRY93988.1 glycosyltransferase family 4 protein [Myxococcota bacterium]HSA24205.1 glycosyltransferase family 4 protein [Myxococcota bacterium]
MRVAFYTQGVKTASSRFRAAQLLPGLAEHGIEGTLLPARPSVHGDVDLAWVHGLRRELFRPLSVLSRAGQLHLATRFDLLYLQRPMLKYYTTLPEEIVTRLRPSIFDMDDAIFHNKLGLDAFRVRRILKLVRHVVVGNRYLADFVGEPARTSIIPTVVDTRRYLPRPDPGDGPFTIGWTGGAHNLVELEPIAPALQQVLRETGGRLRIVAERLEGRFLRELPVDFVPWSPENEVRALAAAHVGIMPLKDTPFNRGKCGFKLIQYMACAIPVVASPVGANRDVVRAGQDGFLAADNASWREALLALARDPALRAQAGAAGRQRAQAEFSLDAVIPRYVELFRRVAG